MTQPRYGVCGDDVTGLIVFQLAASDHLVACVERVPPVLPRSTVRHVLVPQKVGRAHVRTETCGTTVAL